MRKYIPNNSDTRKAIIKKEINIGKDCQHAIKLESNSLILDIIAEKRHTVKSLSRVLAAYKWGPAKIFNITQDLTDQGLISCNRNGIVVLSADKCHCTNGVWFKECENGKG